MIRKLVLSSIAIVALTFGSFSAADAQDATTTPAPATCTQVGYNGCIAYPDGGFGSGTPTATPAPTSSAVVSADTVDATTAGGTDSAIAFTGSESRVLGYAGVSLIGLGAVALVAARRRSESELD